MVREGTLQCACGKIQFDLRLPATSYAIVPQTSVLCQCKDCFTFAHAVNEARAKQNDNDDNDVDKRANMLLGATNAVHMVQFYKSDLTLVRGANFLGRLKLYKNSPILRYYARCCGTPLLIWADYGGPICVLYASLIHGKTARDASGSGSSSGHPVRVPEPTVVLNHATAQPNSAPTPDGLTVRSGMMDAPRFALQFLARVLWGIFTLKWRCPSMAGDVGGPIGDGVESIRLLGTATAVESDSKKQS